MVGAVMANTGRYYWVEAIALEAAIRVLAQLPYGQVRATIENLQRGSSGPHDGPAVERVNTEEKVSNAD